MFFKDDTTIYWYLFFQVKKSFLDAEENLLLKEYYEVLDTYDVAKAEELAARFEDPEDDMYQIKDVLYEDLIEKGGPSKDRLLKCQQRGQYCNTLKAFENNVDRISVMVRYISLLFIATSFKTTANFEWRYSPTIREVDPVTVFLFVRKTRWQEDAGGWTPMVSSRERWEITGLWNSCSGLMFRITRKFYST